MGRSTAFENAGKVPEPIPPAVRYWTLARALNARNFCTKLDGA